MICVLRFVLDKTLGLHVCLFYQKLNFFKSYIHDFLPFFKASSKALDWELYTQSGEL